MFTLSLDEVQPSQLHICSEELTWVLEDTVSAQPSSLGSPPVRKLGARIVVTDGHARAFAAFRAGRRK